MAITHVYDHSITDLIRTIARASGDPDTDVCFDPTTSKIFHGVHCQWFNQAEKPDALTRECGPGCCHKYQVREVQYDGRVLAMGEHNFHDDSDFYAIVVDHDGRVRKVEYATTRFWTYGSNCDVDATPEVIEAARIWAEKVLFDVLSSRNISNSREPEKGKWVRVVKGRKVPKGTEGLIFFTEKVNYDPYKRSWNAQIKVGISPSGIKGENGRYSDALWTYIDNVEVINPDQYLESEVTIRERAAIMAANMAASGGNGFRQMFASPNMLFL